jgi:predicted nucleic acid-binding protein
VANYYLDSSALAKLYFVESGTAWVTQLSQPEEGHNLYIARVTGPEVVAALFRKARGGQYPIRKARRSASDFRADWEQQYKIVELKISLIEEAMALAEKHYLRGYDAIHLAAALEVQRMLQAAGLSSLTFISADVEQLHAARSEGLLVENPDNYT